MKSKSGEITGQKLYSVDGSDWHSSPERAQEVFDRREKAKPIQKVEA